MSKKLLRYINDNIGLYREYLEDTQQIQKFNAYCNKIMRAENDRKKDKTKS